MKHVWRVSGEECFWRPLWHGLVDRAVLHGSWKASAALSFVDHRVCVPGISRGGVK